MSLTEAFDRAGTDKGSRFHNYGRYYERYLAPYKTRPIRYLEIGVHRGRSLKAMHEYFDQAVCIVGIDQTDRFLDSDLRSGYQNIYVEIGDQADQRFLKRVHDQYGPFDVIMDDGSHLFPDMAKSFTVLFPLLANGGLYIVEDTICIRDHLSFFTSDLGRHLNKWRKDEAVPGDHCVDPYKINIQTDDPFEYSMGDIVITNSAVLIHKEVKPHWIKRSATHA